MTVVQMVPDPEWDAMWAAVAAILTPLLKDVEAAVEADAKRRRNKK